MIDFAPTVEGLRRLGRRLFGSPKPDRVRLQLAYRRPLLTPLLADGKNQGIEGLELLAEQFIGAPRPELEELDTLAARFDCTLRSTSLSLGSPERPDRAHLKLIEQLMERIGTERVVEQVGFTRLGTFELPHIAPLPRTAGSVARFSAHIREAMDALGAPILLENIAAMLTTPDEMSEAEFFTELAEKSGCEICLDLGALHANAANFGFSLRSQLEKFPLERVREVHLSGGRSLTRRPFQLLDSHDTAMPAELLRLLASVSARSERLEVVTLERDERIPSLRTLSRELEGARRILRDPEVEGAHAAQGS